MSTVRVRIPCRRFSVRIVLRHADGLGTFDEFVLRTIASGASTVERLADVLGLDRNVVLDACVDLLRAGYVVLRGDDGAVQVTDVVRDEMGDPLVPRPDWARRLAPATNPAPIERDLLQDLVSGSVFAPGTGWASADARLIAPEDEALGSIDSISKSALLQAAASRLRSRDGQPPTDRATALARRGARVTDVLLSGPRTVGGSAASIPASIVVEIAQRDSLDGDLPGLVVVGPAELGGHVRQRIASRLMTLRGVGVAGGSDQFFARLHERLESAAAFVEAVEPLRLLDPTGAVEALQSATNMLEPLPSAEQAQAVHQDLSVLERNASRDIEAATDHRAAVRLVVGASAHHVHLLRALAEAHHQVVLVNPWLGQLERNKDLEDGLIAAVDRGVRVHLVWGVDRSATRESEFGPRARDLVALLQPGDQRVGGLFVSERSAGTHAKAIVCDSAWMLVSSFNFLNSGPDRRDLELGVEVHPPTLATGQSGVDTRASACATLTEVVEWARGLVPDFRLRNLLVSDAALDGRRMPASSVELDGAVAVPSIVGIWRDDFVRRTSALAKRASALGTVAERVVDGEHREFLFHAVGSAKRRVVVSSKDLGLGLLGPSMGRRLLDARARGVEVLVLHSGTAEWSDDLEQMRLRLVAAGARIEQRAVHAKALVCDDWAIVSSYNFLSFAGYYDAYRRTRRELGIRVLDAGFADAVVGTLLDAPGR